MAKVLNVDDLLAEIETTISEIQMQDQRSHQPNPAGSVLNTTKKSESNPSSPVVKNSNLVRKQSYGSILQTRSQQFSGFPGVARSSSDRNYSSDRNQSYPVLSQELQDAQQLEYYSEHERMYPPSNYRTHGFVQSPKQLNLESQNEVRGLKNQLERAKFEIEQQKYLMDLQLQRNRIQERHRQQPDSVYSQASTVIQDQQSVFFPTASSYGITPDKQSLLSQGSFMALEKKRKAESVFSQAPTITSQSSSNSSSNGKSIRSAKKSSYGWTGRSSQRHAGKLSDIIIDNACNIDNELDFLTIMSAVAIIKESAAAERNKGKGAADAVNAVLYVINLEDPDFVKRGIDVLDIMYRNAGLIFILNVSLNLDFFVHFLETRKHHTAAEKENLKTLAGVFAGWYLLEPSKKDLDDASNLSDPTVKVKEFFEGMVRAEYEFPPGSLESIPAEKLEAISAWSIMRKTYTFKMYKK
ncbi:hypothetical protein HK100_002782 [Physocladia obscura]|uniref:Uncharacterized protein n=1 Tax=Physocladia obscura TaxID=109957 RepID=A0AAD5T712_9FUNG|nr:hypothetical protein HK100_002782 [Physocladia obscura]